MAKLRKLIKTLEADGWVQADRRGDLVQLKHPDRPERLTLPTLKANLPPEAARAIAAAAGLKPKGE